MAYVKLNLTDGTVLTAEHVAYMEAGIEEASQTGGTVEVDTTLSVAGKAADAAATGAAIKGCVKSVNGTVPDANGNVTIAADGSGVAIDATLTSSGAAADAKATGDRLKELTEEITALKGEAELGEETKTVTGAVVKCYPEQGSNIAVDAPEATSVWRGGKNLLNISNSNTGNWDLWYQTPVHAGTPGRVDDLYVKMCALPKDVPLVMRYEPWGNGNRGPNTGKLYIKYTDGTSTGAMSEGTPFVIPSGKTIDTIEIYGLQGNTEGGYRNFQVEYGETLTAYEEYRGETFLLASGEATIPALDGVNTIYANTGEVTVTYQKSASADDGASAQTNLQLVFGDGIGLTYDTPEIPALPSVSAAERLSHYYGLYDALVTAYPDYVSKVDCDAECVAAGITRPDYMADYPIYMYKFVPAYTSNSNARDGKTDATKFKVFLVSGTHPEIMGIWDLYNTMRLICEEWQDSEALEALRWQCEIYVMPLSGPYGVAHDTRGNRNGVDLNRNAPGSDWKPTTAGTPTYSGESAGSEYESKVFAHYMQEIEPHVFVDHHNTYYSSDPGCAMYITSLLQSGADVAAAHLSKASRRWKKRFPAILPQDNTTIFGYVDYVNPKQTVGGSRESYANEHGARSYTVETNMTLGYDNGEQTANAHYADATMSTIATDGFLNFLLLALRNAAQRISAGLID